MNQLFPACNSFWCAIFNDLFRLQTLYELQYLGTLRAVGLPHDYSKRLPNITISPNIILILILIVTITTTIVINITTININITTIL